MRREAERECRGGEDDDGNGDEEEGGSRGGRGGVAFPRVTGHQEVIAAPKQEIVFFRRWFQLIWLSTLFLLDLLTGKTPVSSICLYNRNQSAMPQGCRVASEPHRSACALLTQIPRLCVVVAVHLSQAALGDGMQVTDKLSSLQYPATGTESMCHSVTSKPFSFPF